jgi:hypothetical protein
MTIVATVTFKLSSTAEFFRGVAKESRNDKEDMTAWLDQQTDTAPVRSAVTRTGLAAIRKLIVIYSADLPQVNFTCCR